MTTQSKRSVSGTGLVVLALLFLATTVLSNALFRGYRLDLTENRLYTLADGTKNILSDIGEPLNVYLFFSDRATKDIPQLRGYADRVTELLEEFEEQSDGGIRLSIIDPLPFSEEEDRATEYGLQGVSPGGLGADAIYFGIAATNSVGDVETMPFIQPDREAFLEYDLAKLIHTLAQPDRPVVGIISSLPMTSGFDPATGRPSTPWVVATQIEQLFEVRSLEAGVSASAIDDDITLLVVVHPKALDDETLYAIDQFVMGGGRLIVFVDPMSDAEIPNDPSAQNAALFADRSSTLDRLFNAWGWSVPTDEIVLDQKYALTVNAGGPQGTIRHLAFIGVDADGLSDEDVVTSDLERINFASTGHIVLADDAAVTITPLVLSSEQADLTTTETLRFLPDPGVLQDNFEATGERYVLAARLNGALESAFPEGPPSEGDESAPRPEHLAASDGEVNVVVVADTDMASDRMWAQVQSFFGQQIVQAFADNGPMIINALENMIGSSDLISIRSRGTFSRPFERVEALQAEADAEYRIQQQALEDRLEETEAKLAELQSAKDEDSLLIISDEQQQALLRFQQDRIEIRKELRDVQHNLDRSIESLGTRLKLINIFLVPLLMTVIAIAWLIKGPLLLIGLLGFTTIVVFFLMGLPLAGLTLLTGAAAFGVRKLRHGST